MGFLKTGVSPRELEGMSESVDKCFERAHEVSHENGDGYITQDAE